MGQRGEVFSWRIPSTNEDRTYFLNLKENRMGDLYLTLVESKKHGETDFERHQVMIFEEDFRELRKGFERVFAFIDEREAERGAARRTGPGEPGGDRPKRRFTARRTSGAE